MRGINVDLRNQSSGSLDIGGMKLFFVLLYRFLEDFYFLMSREERKITLGSLVDKLTIRKFGLRPGRIALILALLKKSKGTPEIQQVLRCPDRHTEIALRYERLRRATGRIMIGSGDSGNITGIEVARIANWIIGRPKILPGTENLR